MIFPRIVHISGALLGDDTISPTAKLVAAYIDAQATLAGGHGLWVRPKQKQIADALGVARETINRALKQLVARGYVECRNVTSASRGRTGLEYSVRFDRDPETLAVEAGADVTETSQPDVTKPSPQKTPSNPPMCANDHTNAGADAIPGSPKTPDVTETSQQKPDVTGTSQKEIPPTPPKEKLPLLFSSDELNNTPDATGDKPKGGKRAKSAGGYTAEFETFWRSWPAEIRKGSDKGMSAKRWAVARKTWSAETLMLATSHYLRGTKVDDAEPGPWKPRTCQAQVFLNGKLEASVEAAIEAQQAKTTRENFTPAQQRFLCELHKKGEWPSDVARDVIKSFPVKLLAEFGIEHTGRAA